MIICCMVGKYCNNGCLLCVYFYDFSWRSASFQVYIKLLFTQPCLLYNRGYNVAQPWQRLFSLYRYIVSVLVAILDQLILAKVSISTTDTICIGILIHP